MAHRYFVENINNNIATVSGDEAKHLIKVMRIKAGDELVLTDNNGFDYKAVATKVNSDDVYFDVMDKYPNLAEPKNNVTLYMALPKGDKLEMIVQKACELGANKLIPFVSEFCVAQKSKKDENKRQRLQKISNEACKQSGRSIPLSVSETMTFKQVLQDMKNQDVNLFFYEKGGQPLSSIDFSKGKNIGIIIGSEGGFSEKEAGLICDNNGTVIGLGNRILRCETAAIAALSIVMYTLGEME